MRKLLFVFMFIGSGILLLLAGCTGEGFQVEIEPTAPVATLSPTPVAALPSATETALATAIATAEPEPVSTPTLEPSAMATPILPTPTPTIPALLQPNRATMPVVCRQFKSYINIQQETNNVSNWLMNFVFEQEDVITFLMWSNRPYPESSPTPVITPVSEGGGPPYPLGELSQSRRVLLKGQTWDFNTGTLVETPVTEQDAMQNPCDQDCPLEVIGVAPDNSWQLLQITEAPAEYQGLWLVNEETVYNLVPYVPFFSDWRWSADSRMLWLLYTLQYIDGETYGAEDMVVDLATPALPRIVFRSWDAGQWQWLNYLPPSRDGYEFVFSPADKTMLAYEYFGAASLIPQDNRLYVYHIDFSADTPHLQEVYEARFPTRIDWSEALQDFVVTELSSAGAAIYALNHEVVYEIPMEVIKHMPRLVGVDGQIRTDLNTEIDITPLYWRLTRIAISPDLQHVVLMSERGEAWAFSCSD
jgi:hypothetical protein